VCYRHVLHRKLDTGSSSTRAFGICQFCETEREREDGCLRSIPILLYWEYFRLVFVEHLVEGIIQLSGHSVNLQFLSDDLVFKFINPEVKLADVHLCILRARF